MRSWNLIAKLVDWRWGDGQRLILAQVVGGANRRAVTRVVSFPPRHRLRGWSCGGSVFSSMAMVEAFVDN